MTFNLGVQQLVAGPTKTSHAISIATEGDNIVLELEEAGRMVLPMNEATPMVEEVELDYGTDAKSHVEEDFVTMVEEELLGGRRAKRSTLKEAPSTLLSSYGVVFMVVGVTAALVGVVVAVRATLTRSRRKSEVISYA